MACFSQICRGKVGSNANWGEEGIRSVCPCIRLSPSGFILSWPEKQTGFLLLCYSQWARSFDRRQMLFLPTGHRLQLYSLSDMTAILDNRYCVWAGRTAMALPSVSSCALKLCSLLVQLENLIPGLRLLLPLGHLFNRTCC